jgi:ribosome maturation factor RimP
MNRETDNIDKHVEPAASSGSERFVYETGLAGQVAGIAEPVIEGLGYRLVRVKISGQDGLTVQIMAERPDGTMAIEDCEKVSRDLSAVLDTFDPLPGAYRLEISSPGIDRPLVRANDFDDWQGHEVRIELKEAVSGRKRWRGEIEGLIDGEVRVVCEVEGLGLQTVGFPVALVAEARLVLTDDLVRDALRAARGKEALGDNVEESDRQALRKTAAKNADKKPPRGGSKSKTKPGQSGETAPSKDQSGAAAPDEDMSEE